MIMNDIEWTMLSYYGIYYEKFKNVMQQTEKVALSLNNNHIWPCTNSGDLYRSASIVKLSASLMSISFSHPGPDGSTLEHSAQLVTVKYELRSTLSNLWSLRTSLNFVEKSGSDPLSQKGYIIHIDITCFLRIGI